MPTGTIKKLVADRGFGFIAAEDGKEFFFHRSGTEGDFDSLRGGEKVTFEIEASPKGPRARSVRTGRKTRVSFLSPCARPAFFCPARGRRFILTPPGRRAARQGCAAGRPRCR